MIEKASVAAAIVPMTRRMKSSFIQASHESLPRGRTRTLRPSGTQQWKQLCWPNLGSDPAKKRGSATDVVLGPRLSCRPRVTYLGPRAEEHRSATERKCCRGLRAIAYELLCEEILCFAILALGPGSRSARVRALATLARDTRLACPGRAPPDLIRGSRRSGTQGHAVSQQVADSSDRHMR